MTKSERARKTRLAYLRTFCGDLESPHVNGDAVLADLKKFCGITNKAGIVISPKSGMTDPYATAYLAGQRDVFLRIAFFLGIDERQLIQEKDHVETQTPTRTAEQ